MSVAPRPSSLTSALYWSLKRAYGLTKPVAALVVNPNS